ncbi:MAG: YbaK/EbsC family protein [Planctomycetia bacterium]|nr:YbaK/EbsC family protein [Planctomycetia bacterium]
MATARWIREMLTQRGIPFQELHHREVFTSQEVAQCEHTSGHHVAKVVVAMADGRPVELVLPASRRVALKKVKNVLGAKDVRLASEAEMEKFFQDCQVGAVPPLRHWKDVDVLMDESLNVTGEILFQAATHEDAVRLRFGDWYDLVLPRVADFTEPEAVTA